MISPLCGSQARIVYPLSDPHSGLGARSAPKDTGRTSQGLSTRTVRCRAPGWLDLLRRLPLPTAFIAALVTGALLLAQGTPPPAPLVLVSRDGRRPVPTTLLSGQEFIALDDVATLFQVSVREDALAGGVTVAYKGRTIVLSSEQPMASVGGQVVALPAPAVRNGRRWLVPVEFLSRALAPIYDARIELRRASRLLIVGDLRVPRVVARIDSPGPPTRITMETTPAATLTVAQDGPRLVARVDADAIDPCAADNGRRVGRTDSTRAINRQRSSCSCAGAPERPGRP